jgi:RNA polymerase sigma factor (sigma-70 family)
MDAMSKGAAPLLAARLHSNSMSVDSMAIENAELVAKALQQIDPELRRIVELKELDELSYAEIGEIVGIPEGTVGSRLNRARKELQVILLNLGWEL